MAMDSTHQWHHLLELGSTCAGLDDPTEMLDAATTILLAQARADAVLVLTDSPAATDPGDRVSHRAGLPLDPGASIVAPAPAGTGELVAVPPIEAALGAEAPVPAAWRRAGITHVAVRRLPEHLGQAVLAWSGSRPEDLTGLEVALAILDPHLQRVSRPVATSPANIGEIERRQALEINDNVVQGLAAAAYALDQGQVTEGARYLNRTLKAARAMMDELLEPTHGHGLTAGDLVRTTPATMGGEHVAASSMTAVAAEKSVHTVLVVDDADDLRMLLRARMESRTGLTVIGEAADGLAAVELASELQPDLVMLDLAMPRMDGLEALPLIRAAVPGVRVIVLSGFNQSTLAEKAMEAGADRYVVKGGSMRQLLELVDTVLEDAS